GRCRCAPAAARANLEPATMTSTLVRPQSDEFAAYYQKYVERVPDGDVVELLARQIEDTAALLAAVKESDAGFRYAPGKWSIREVVGHLADSERVFAYRALRFARGDETALASFEQDAWMPGAGLDQRSPAELVAAYRDVPRSTQ